MELKPIRTKVEYKAALATVETLWDAPSKSREADHLEVLVLLIQDYEARHYAIADPDPVNFLLHVMDARGLARKDLEPYLGSRARVAEVLNRVRPLSLDMIRRLAAGLSLLAEVLIQPYDASDARRAA